VRGAGIRHHKGRELEPGMARKRRLEFAAEGRVCSLEQHLDIPARQHRADVAGAGRPAVGRDLHRLRRRRKTRARKRCARRLRVAHEMADVIEENFLVLGQLAIGFVHCDDLSHNHAVLRGPCDKTRALALTRLAQDE
jgi:hypothetical protein